MKKYLKLTSIFSFLAILLVVISGCSNDDAEAGKIKVSVTSVPHAEIMEHIKPELAEKGVELELVVADDYDVHNRSLDEKEVDANYFQHTPFLEEQIADFDYDIIEFGKIHLEPLGVYSEKYDSLDDLPDGAVISIPNDPTKICRT